ncbi:uncharacterized protein LOC132716757 [Ruditapes philippinarum]|uniref:uncharacterized protein LOC132716757 n=1 Tax=Ruditapes philippinarum TaxID=129788 RepID=UPI00295AC57B|nr:uncharacterized protein LOC132716757 [Ruditapes philippinarum]XP_060556070.1 uncharacterized protein LOC132716757 [Ruditapes philippinarum]XP_060556071.1 uncharacterized protein LOC132716757 [Ruditapes philippinarum]XP_060556072.1 uncharacterized protein LOC132716757 [Ruditapes philippinarum]
MLKYTAVGNDDGLVSPTHHPDYTHRTIDVSAGSKGTKMAIKRRSNLAKKILSRNDETAHLPPIAQPGSPQQNMTISSSLSQERKENIHFINHPIKRKDIRTPYVSHVNRISDVATPYVLHTQITNIDPSTTLARENSKLSKYSGNVVEYKHEPEIHHEGTFTSLQKNPTSNSPAQDRRPRGRHGRKSNSFNENDFRGNTDIRELTIQSNQMGLYQRAERKRDKSREKGNESFSIRKKIEQFRRWHEEQYREKIKKLKQEVDHQFEAEHNRVSRQVGPLRETPTSKNDMSVTVDNEKVPSEVSHEKMEQDKLTPNPLSVTNESSSKARSGSARTWKTWRNVNDSYAYNDVHKYIKENELMDDEKSNWIKKWILEVNRAMKDLNHESIL